MTATKPRPLTTGDVMVTLLSEGYPTVFKARQARVLMARYGIDLPTWGKRDVPMAVVAEKLRDLLNEGSMDGSEG